MAKTIQQVLGAKNLIGLIQGVVNGVPADLLPQGMLTPTVSVEGNRGSYTKVEGTRATARLVHYGAPSVRRGLKGVAEVPVNLAHTFEHQVHPAPMMLNLQAEDSSAKQKMGRQTLARQVNVFGTLFRNLRISAVYSALSKGAIYFDGDGNLLPTASTAKVTIDFRIPAGNKTALDVLGDGAILSAWDTAGTDIIGQIRNLRAAGRQLTGYPIVNALYGADIPGVLMKNTAIAALVGDSPKLTEQLATGSDIPNGLMGINWFPVNEAFFADSAGADQTWFSGRQITFMPAVSQEWYDFAEGSYLIPRSLNMTSNAEQALSNLQEVFGPFSYATITEDPPGIKHYAGDTFLPLIKVPNAVFIATAPT